MDPVRGITRLEEQGDVLKNIIIKKELKRKFNLSNKDIKDIVIYEYPDILVYNKEVFNKIRSKAYNRIGYISVKIIILGVEYTVGNMHFESDGD